MKIDLVVQRDAMDCGPSCLLMISRYYGRNLPLENLREMCYITKTGVSLLGISDAAEKIGFRTTGAKVRILDLLDVQLPCIAHWKGNHFIVVYDVKKSKDGVCVYVADPAGEKLMYTEEEFGLHWHSTVEDGEPHGIILILEPTPEFYEQREEVVESNAKARDWGYFFRYLRPYRRELWHVALCLLVTSLLQLIFPFLTQSLVDTGIHTRSQNFVTLILIAQLVLFIARLSVEFIRSWLLLHISYRVNLSFLSDYLIKLMRLPIRFFDSKNVGDIIQRIQDNNRIQNFLTGASISTIFSLLSFVIFSVILATYDSWILITFLIGNSLYVIWVLLFLRQRKSLDHKRFSMASSEQSNLYQLVTGMQEIKLNNCEQEKRWEWERIQVKLFRIGIKGLALGQIQQAGTVFFSQTTNILISYITARAVISGEMTLGMMMSISYIVGQLSSPVEQFIGFSQGLQDAKLSVGRLMEVYQEPDEVPLSSKDSVALRTELPVDKSIKVENVYFSYSGSEYDHVLQGVDLIIPENKVTAIVGASGSGKTTILKLLLGFYPVVRGAISVGKVNMKDINASWWRSRVGAVMQDGFIFTDTIARNIALEESIDKSRLEHAISLSCLQEYIDKLPLGINTKIGAEGNGLSQGQKQRILIARAIYKQPDYILLDEATNALDANNEKAIMEGLREFYKGRTVVVVAHRLSTVRDADNIVVVDNGRIIEQGTHEELSLKRGYYYKLVRNQLELGV